MWGWRPRASFKILTFQAIHEVFSRPIFLALILISLTVGVAQVSIFLSVILGVQNYVNDAMTSGSRLNRVEIKPRSRDRSKEDRFPVYRRISEMKGVDKVVRRRSTVTTIVGHKRSIKYNTLGLHADDPEYALFDFVAGSSFSGNHDQLEIIITVGLLNDLFNTSSMGKNGTDYNFFIGKKVEVKVPQFTNSGHLKNETSVFLTIKGIILHAEGNRDLYLPNTTHLVFDRFKMDRFNKFPMPIVSTADSWSDEKQVIEMANFPWEDSLQIYAKEMSDVLPIIKGVSKLGYRAKSDIWNFKWALDVQDTAKSIFLPLTVLIFFAVIVTVFANIFTSAKLREKELALWRIIGMRRGDLVFTQLISTFFSVVIGTLLGLGLSWILIEKGKAHLLRQSKELALHDSSSTQNLEAIFAPMSEFSVIIFFVALLTGLLAALYPALRASKTDPAIVLQS